MFVPEADLVGEYWSIVYVSSGRKRSVSQNEVSLVGLFSQNESLFGRSLFIE